LAEEERAQIEGITAPADHVDLNVTLRVLNILWMEKILHHLGWLKHVETLPIMG